LVELDFVFQAEDGIRDFHVTGVQTCALPIWGQAVALARDAGLDDLDRPVAGLPTAARHRVRLARSLAAAPSVLLVEHPRAGLDEIGRASWRERRAYGGGDGTST